MTLFPVFIFVCIAIGLGAVLLSISAILGKKVTTVRTHDVYESGVNPVGSASRRYDIKFYVTAILFLLFDVEIVFLFPWALSFLKSNSQQWLLLEFAFFMAVLVVGYIFVIISKSLDWEK